MTKKDVQALLQSNRQRRFRQQTGTVVERKGAFWLRFYRDGENGSRIKVTEKLCDVSTEHYSVDCTAVDILRNERMAAINKGAHADLHRQTPAPEAPPMTIGTFWVTVYQPWIKNNKRWSTWRGYEKLWEQYLQDELSTKPLATYSTLDGGELLDRLASKLNENSLAHVRSLLSGIFKRAANTKGPNGKALITSNPIRDVEVSVRVRQAKARVKYTPEETIAILNAIPDLIAKLFFSLVAVMGMRPSEVAGLKWQNIKGDLLLVRESAPYGKLGELKTANSKRDLTIIEPVLSMLNAFRDSLGKPTSGLLFTNGSGEPVNHNAFVRRHIAPEAKKACARWCGLYSGRHGTATALLDLTGDIRAAYQVLGNTFETLSKTYIEPKFEQGKAGLSKLQDHLKSIKPQGEKG
jgi:integrase